MTIVGRKLTRPGGSGRWAAAAADGEAMETDLANSGTGHIKTYGMNVPFMQPQRHDWDIHIV